jgi:WS/DGAT/MGAT family acyltransferase
VPDPSRRLSEADAIFLPMGEAVGSEMAPLTVAVLAGPIPEDAAVHQTELICRLLPHLRHRIVRDRVSLALPRWVDVPGFDPHEVGMQLPAPGDGTLQAVLDWAGPWGALAFPDDRPPWRSVTFDDVVVDGVPGRTVVVSQSHHAMIDGGGARRLGEHYFQFAPDAPLSPLPPLAPPEEISPWERWKEGWALEGRKARAVGRATATRLRWAAREPRAAAERGVEIVKAARRLQSPVGPTPLSPLLVRQSKELRFHALEVDLAQLKVGARAAGGSINDGFMAAVSLGLRQWHLDHGVRVPTLRTAMAINRRPEGTSWEGNEVLAVVLHMPVDDDDPARLVKRCREVSLDHREDEDALWLLDRVRAAGNRLPFPVTVALSRQSLAGLDISLSNVAGISQRRWVGGVEQLRDLPFVVGTLSAVAMILTSRGDTADLGLTTCPVAIPDPQHLVDRLAEGFAMVGAIGS